MSTWNNVTYQHSTNVPKALPNAYFYGDPDEYYQHYAWVEGVEWAIEAIRCGDLIIDGVDFQSIQS